MGAALAAMKALPYAIALYRNRDKIGKYASDVLDFTRAVRTKRAEVQLDEHAESANTISAGVRRAYASGIDFAHDVAQKVKDVIPALNRAAPKIDEFVIPAANAAASRYATKSQRGRQAPRAAA